MALNLVSTRMNKSFGLETNLNIYLFPIFIDRLPEIQDCSYVDTDLVAPYGINSREFMRAQRIANRVFKKYLPVMARKLANFHQCGFGLAQWELAIAAWLELCVNALINRLLHLKKIDQQYEIPVLHRTCFFRDNRFVRSNSTFEFISKTNEDLFNLFIYSLLLDRFNFKNIRNENLEDYFFPIHPQKNEFNFYGVKKFLRNKFNLIARVLNNWFPAACSYFFQTSPPVQRQWKYR